jgi:hypothetical protein
MKRGDDKIMYDKLKIILLSEQLKEDHCSGLRVDVK